MNATGTRDRYGDSRGSLAASLCVLFAACSGVDGSGEATLGAGHDGATDGDESILDMAGTDGPAPVLIGELSCQEPGHAGVERELPEGTETTVPVPAGLPELLTTIRAAGGRPRLRFDHSRAGELLNVRVRVQGDQIRRSALTPDHVDVDLGALTVRLTHDGAGTDASSGPQLELPSSLPLEQAVVLKTYTRARTADGLGPAALAMVSVFDRRDEAGGPVATLPIDAETAMARSLDCDALAYERASEVPSVSVSFPPLRSCDLDECAKTKAAWLRANHDLYRIRQMLDFVAASPPEQRRFLWEQEGATRSGKRLMSYESDEVGPNTALAYYFGPYADYRLDAIRWAYARLWREFHDHDIDGLDYDIECTPDRVGDICNTTQPGGHHAVKGNVKLCGKAYSTPSQIFDVPRLIIHESMHHMFVPWQGDIGRLSPILDTHTHGHGAICLGHVVTDKGYGLSHIKHLAEYRNSKGGDCYHSNFAFRNNDTYAYAAATIGTYIRFGFLDHWPIEEPPEADDNFPPPECGQVGVDQPPPGFVDPLSKCTKIGGELVCPGNDGLLPADLDIAVICPEW